MSGKVYLDGKLIGTDAVLLIENGMSFTEIGALIHTAIDDPGVRTIVLDIQPGEYSGRPDWMDIIEPKKSLEELRAPRSYLRHDPTKNVMRRRRGKPF